MSKDRARLSILSSLLAFPTINQKDWQGGLFSEARVGDLVSLCSAPVSKWYLSWVKEVGGTKGYPKYLLESIDDGELCWWENVGLNVYSRERVAERPTWRWDDKQFAFNSRWCKACKRNGAYMILPCLPVFNEDGSVMLDVRIRHGFNKFSDPQTFPNWKKLTIKEMEVFYLGCCAKYNYLPKHAESIS